MLELRPCCCQQLALELLAPRVVIVPGPTGSISCIDEDPISLRFLVSVFICTTQPTPEDPYAQIKSVLSNTHAAGGRGVQVDGARVM